MNVWIKARFPGEHWTARNEENDQWVKRTDLESVHFKNGKVFLFYRNGNREFVTLSQMSRLSIEEEHKYETAEDSRQSQDSEG